MRPSNYILWGLTCDRTFTVSKTPRMRRSPQQINELLDQQAASNESIASFCQRHDLNPGTFYAWRVKYKPRQPRESAGFTQLVTPPLPAAPAAVKTAGMPPATFHLPGGIRLEVRQWSIAELVSLGRSLASDA